MSGATRPKVRVTLTLSDREAAGLRNTAFHLRMDHEADTGDLGAIRLLTKLIKAIDSAKPVRPRLGTALKRLDKALGRIRR